MLRKSKEVIKAELHLLSFILDCMLKIMVCECEVHRDEFTQFFSITAAAVAANLQQIPENVFL